MPTLWDSLSSVFGGNAVSGENQRRLKRLAKCPQNEMLPRIPLAGQVENGSVLMHNGLLLRRASLRNDWAIAVNNRGVLEPQHEYAFAQIAQSLGPAPTMLDIGARSGFYSMWLKMLRPGARCVMVEPNKSALKQGEKNFKLNKLQSQSMGAYISARGGRMIDNIPVKTITELSSHLKADYISILHADIQGYELELLTGGEPLIKDRGIDYVLISTHADVLHKDCREYLEQMRYIVLADIPPSVSYCPDGLLVMRRKELVKGIDPLPLQPRKTDS